MFATNCCHLAVGGRQPSLSQDGGNNRTQAQIADSGRSCIGRGSHEQLTSPVWRCECFAARRLNARTAMPCSQAHGGDDKGGTALQWASGMPHIASRRACAESEQVCASRCPFLAVPTVVLAVCSLLVLQAPGARAQQDATTYKNATQILSILGSSWMGSGYDDSGDAHYLFRPGEDMTGERLCFLMLSAVLRLHAAYAWSSCLVPCLFPREQMLRVIRINMHPTHVSFGRAAADAPPEVPALGHSISLLFWV